MTITMPLGCCNYNLTTVSGSESPLKVMFVCIIDTGHCTILPSEQKPSENFCMWGSFCLNLSFFLRSLHVTFCIFIQVSVQTAPRKEAFDFLHGK